MVGAASSRYEVVCRLAGGGMADVYLARATGLGGFERLVVVKRLSQQLADNPQAIQALYDEARIVATLCHTNIVQVNDVEILDGQVSIVMEFLHGHDVSQLLGRLQRTGERLPLDQAIGIAAAVCAGLHHAHERVGSNGQPLEIVHRDVSPHNVFVTYEGTVKLIDFGIARAATRRNRTELGVIKGKPGYIAPEQLRGKRVDRRTDVWATGVLLYEMTTGTRPFGNDPAAMDQLVAVITTDPPPPSSRVADYPRALEAIVMRAMARDAAARYPTTAALLADLDAFARAHGLDQSPFRLGALVQRVFAPQLAAWQQAQRDGRSLADHVASRASRSFHGLDVEEALATEAREPSASVPSQGLAPPPPRRRAPRWLLAAAAVLALPVIALAGVAAWGALGGGRRDPLPMATQPTPLSAPVELPAVHAPAVHEAPPAPPAPVAHEIREIEMPTAPARSEPRPRPRRARPAAPRPTTEDDLDAPLPR